MSAQLIKRVNQYRIAGYAVLSTFGAFVAIAIAESVLTYFGF